MSVKLSVRGLLGPVGILAGLAVLFGACGARDEIPVPPPPPPLPDCLVDADCEGFDDLCRNVRCVVEEDAGGGGFGGGDEQGLTLPSASCFPLCETCTSSRHQPPTGTSTAPDSFFPETKPPTRCQEV